MAFRTLGIDITAKDRSGGAVSSATGGLNSIATIGKRAALALAPLVTVFTAVRIVRGVGNLVKAFTEQERSIATLNAALRVTGQLSDANSQKIQAFASAMQQVTEFGDDELVQASATLLQLATKLSADEAAQAQKAIIGLAAAFGLDLENAAALVGKTLASSTNALSRYGIVVDTSASQSAKLAAILRQTGGFFDVAQARATTLSGRLAQLSNAAGDFKEALGKIVAEGTGLGELAHKATLMIQDLTAVVAGGGAALQRSFELLGIVGANAFSMAVLQGVIALPQAMADAVTKVATTLLPERLGKLISAPARGINEAAANLAERLLTPAIDAATANVKGALIELREFATAAGGGPAPAPSTPAAPKSVGKFEAFGKQAGAGFVKGLLDGTRDIENAFESMGKSLVDTLSHFLATGELKFGEFVTRVLQELSRIALSDLFRTLLKTIGVATPGPKPAATGANVRSGELMLVGERGPELFEPGRSGQIRPIIPAVAHVPGAAGAGMVLNSTTRIEVYAMDSRDVDRFFRENAARIQGIVTKGVRDSAAYAAALRR